MFMCRFCAVKRQMTFDTFGGAHHLRIESSADFNHVLALDEAHWVATGAVTNSLRCDPVFLDLLDTDDNRRLMCYEVRVAIKWLMANLTDHSGIDAASDVLRVSAVNPNTADGKKILTAVNKILKKLDPEAAEITLSQVREVKAQQEALPVSEAGVILPSAAKDPELQKIISDLIDVTGGTPHPSGKPGLDEEDLERFAKEAAARLDWLKKMELPAGTDSTEIMPLGEATREAYKIYSQLKERIDHFFAQCDAVAFDERTASHFLPSEAQLGESDLNDAAVVEQVLKRAPLAAPAASMTLTFDHQLNPAYAELLEAFREKVLSKLLDGGTASLSKADWKKIKGIFKPHEAWLDSEPAPALGKIDPAKLTSYQEESVTEALRKIIAEKAKTAYVLDNIRLAEKLILYQANIISFLNNFVSFPDLYDPNKRALFEMGTLIIDGRHLNFSTRVDDIAAHSKIAETSEIFVVYAEIHPSDPKAPKTTVALPVTSGTKGNLHVGKRGVFRDLKGDILDAQIVKIIENPISLWETLVSPFTRIARMITSRIESMTAAAEKKLDKAAASVTEGTAQPTAQQKGAMAGGILMGGGVAIAALGSSFAFITKTLAGLGWLKTLLGLLAAILAFVLPASIVAISKLRRRDISSILEGAGWAINARMHLNRTQGRTFTRKPHIPEEALVYPRAKWWMWLILAALLAALIAAIMNGRP